MRAWDFATRAFALCRIHSSSRAIAFWRLLSVRSATVAIACFCSSQDE